MKIDVVELQLLTRYQIELETDFDCVYGIETAQSIFYKELAMCNVEKIGIICVDCTNKILNYANISIGNLKEVRVPLGELFKVVLLSNASKFIIAHNHPSGVLQVTSSDICLTKKIGAVAKIFDVSLIDSIIINYKGEMISIREHIKELT